MRIPGIFTLRVYAYLRRGVVAIERIADAAESLAYAESERRRAEAIATAPRKPRALVVTSLDPAEANALWHAQEQAAGREGLTADGGSDVVA